MNKEINFDGPRACGQYDLSGVIDLCNLVMRVIETHPDYKSGWPNIGYLYPHVYNHENAENIRLISINGKPVSSVAIYSSDVKTSRGNISVGGINCFVTHPEFRRSGLGGLVLDDAHRKMESIGNEIALLSTMIPDYYRKSGWELAGGQRTFTLDRGNISYLPDRTGLDIEEDWKPYLAKLMELNQQQPLRASRTSRLFELLIERRLGRVFIARRGDRIVAYCALGHSQNPQVIEYGGRNEDVCSLIRGIFGIIDDLSISTSTRSGRERPTTELSVTTPYLNHGLSNMLLERGIPNSLGYIGMIKILDPYKLFKTLGLDDVINLEKNDMSWRVSHGTNELILTDHELVKLVFGPEQFQGFAPQLFPVDFYQFHADRV